MEAFLGRRALWMLGITPPCEMHTPPSSLFSSSSLRTASWMCRGTIRLFLLSREAFPASSSTCQDKDQLANLEWVSLVCTFYLPQPLDTRERWRGKREPQHQLAPSSCPFAGDDEFGPRETADQRESFESWTWSCPPYQLYHGRSWWVWVWREVRRDVKRTRAETRMKEARARKGRPRQNTG